MQGKIMESSEYIPMPATLEPMDCSGFAPLSLSDELKLFLSEPAVPLDFYNVAEPSCSNPLVSSDFDYALSRSSVFPFDPVVSVEDLEFLGGDMDFRIHENVPSDVVFMDVSGMLNVDTNDVGLLGPQNFVSDGYYMKPDPKSSVLILDGKGENHNVLGCREEEKGPEIATVPVDIIHNKRPFKCMHLGCDKTFRNPQTLKLHHKTHYKQMNDCLVPRTSKSGHNKKIPCRCPVCGQTFVGLYELRRHFGRKHSDGEKMHDCKKCGKKFYIEVDLRDHEKLCGERVGCKCGLKFAFKCSLSDHKRTHPECAEEPKKSANAKTVPAGIRSKSPSLGLMGMKLEDIWGLGCRSRSSTVVRGTSRK